MPSRNFLKDSGHGIGDPPRADQIHKVKFMRPLPHETWDGRIAFSRNNRLQNFERHWGMMPNVVNAEMRDLVRRFDCLHV